jgi:asparagine synthase (glutamine-hydrolysing)
MPRIAGILSKNPEAVSGFLEMTTAHFAANGEPEPKLILLPRDQPVVGLVLATRVRPPVTWWSAADGSFAVIDGEIYDLGNGQGHATPRQEGNLAERVFWMHRNGGAAALGQIDASAIIAIWDAPRQELMVFRDVDGNVPAFYSSDREAVIFGSEAETLLSVGVANEVDVHALDYFLAKGYAPAPWTFVKGIRKIQPAHVLTCHVGGARIPARYFRQSTGPKQVISPPDRTERIRELMIQSLHRRCHGGETSAVLLSGGVDSAVILASLVRLASAPAEAFTFSYSDYNGPYNEVEAARKVATSFGVRHETVVCRPVDLADALPRLVANYGEPFAWGIHSFMLHRLAQAGFTAVMTGNEPEWNIRKVDRAAIRFRGAPAPLRMAVRAGWSAARPFLPHAPAGGRAAAVAAIMRSSEIGVPPQLLHPSIMGYELRRSLYIHPELAQIGRRSSETLFMAALEEVEGEDPYDQARLLDHRFLDAEAIFFWNSKWARTYNLAIRHPLCDRDMRDFFYHLDARAEAKRHLRDFAATLLPPDVVEAPRFPHTIPVGHWFKGPLRPLVLDVLSPSRLRDSPFQPEVVARLVQEHLDGRVDHTWRVWSLITVMTWLETVLRASRPLHRQKPTVQQVH